ncbi:MAG: protease pro-enzyme activation domain-containing protein [Mycobacterium sp.]|uniref:S53 family peptidase n=1 Tax=Mycobacterium sp. TaxID=1785 RepID=UPI003F98A0E7
MGYGRLGLRAGSGGVRVRLLVLAAAAVLMLAAGARAAPTCDAPNLIGGPLGRLLAGATDLGPARGGHAQFTVALRDAIRPKVLLAWAKDHGLSVRWRAGDDWAFVEGAPRDLGSAFGVAVHDYRSRGGQVFYASAVQPTVPAAVQAEVTGLGRILSYHRVHVVKPPSLPVEAPMHGLTPTQLLTTYNAGPLAATGKGQTIVFFEIDGYDQFNLGSYSGTFGLSQFTPTLVGGQPAPPIGETEMDLEVAHAIAPDARLVVVNAIAGLGISPDPDSKVFATAEFHEKFATMFEAVDRQFPGAIWNLSIGFDCDKETALADVRPMRAALANAEEHGTSAFTASGDTGGLECKSQDFGHFSGFSDPPTEDDAGVSTLAALPEMTDVGGTSLSTDENGVWLAEQVWVDSAMSQGTGGGVSSLFPRPAFQNSVSVPQDATHRLTPDVAADADPASGAYVLTGGQWSHVGGTSLSAPIWAALTALMNQYLVEHGGKALGNLNPLLYRVAAGAARPAFHDVTLGGNAVDNAGTGFDLVTGLGTPNVDNLVHDLLDVQRGGG